MATIAQLAEREQKLMADLAEVREEIASRAGEADKPVKAAKVQKG
jgi:hypothetical protein